MSLDLLVRGGELVDGTGAPRRRVDIGITNGTITAVGDLTGDATAEAVDATGLIVAPGVIDTHTHYDAQVHWDPHCTNSGTHGVTTAVIGNCGFGFAPCPPELRGRYMQMMERTEQVPLHAMQSGITWDWITFPEWLEHLRHIPKGINLSALVPVNPLLIYVMGLDAAKSRPASTAERAEMRRLLHEAMDCGAAGFGFSWMGPTNNHIDADGSPMPSDVMAIEEAYNLASVLRERDQGVIQATTEVARIGEHRDVCAELARRSGRPVFYNAIQLFRDSDEHLQILDFLDRCATEGLPVYGQSFVNRVWTEFTAVTYDSWSVHPLFREFTEASADQKLVLAASPDFRQRFSLGYDLTADQHSGTKFHEFTLLSACGLPPWVAYEGRTITEIAETTGRDVVETFFDVLVTTKLKAEFTHLDRYVQDPDLIASVLKHPRVIAGGSDGGAHVKFVSNGQWSTDFIAWLARDQGRFTIEEMHQKLSQFPASLLGLSDRGTLEVGKAADMMIYDLDDFGYRYGRYAVLDDLPGGEWRRFAGVQGLRYVVVNGEVTMVDGSPVGIHSGKVVA